MAHQHAAAHHSADDEYRETPAGASHEYTDANVWAIAKFGLWLIITALIVHVGIGMMYALLIEQATVTGEQRYPLASSTDSPLPPEPRLQQSPAAEMVHFRTLEERRLQGYGWVDKENGVVHIPIEEAMRLAIERGLPARADDPARSAASSSMLASDASAGRVLEQRK
jgi:hypothetical protein